MGSEDSRLIVVLPTYNEAENLPLLVPYLLDVASLHVLVVDDDSPDCTGQVAERLKEQYKPKVDVLHRRGVPRGLGLAYATGFKMALEQGAEIVIGIDADLSHSPSYIPGMLEMMSGQGCDIVVGSRYIPGGGIEGNWSWQRRFLSWGAQQWVRMMLGVKVHDVTGAFRCYSRRALLTLDFSLMRLDGFSFLIEVIYQAERRSLKVREFPIIFHDREHGTSKVSPSIVAKALMRVARMRLMRGG